MINFPIFKRLDISDFGLYPGVPGGEQGLHIEFKNGLTLVLGANGLGKTTLVNILYRLLTGPFDIPGLTDRPELGNLKIEAKSLNKYDKSIFSKRVVDAAAYSRARLVVQFGDYEVVVERNLQSLNLTLFSIDGEVFSNDEIASYQSAILDITGVSSFGDWILLLRHLVFYFEDRRALVWDTSAQKEILRILFLSNDISKQWTADAREILEVDSRMRNLNAVLGKEEKALSQTEAKTKDGIATIEELKLIEQLQTVDELQLEKLQEDFTQVEASLQLNKLKLLKADQEFTSAFRAVEHAKLASISASFPDLSENMQFIFANLLTENKCIACGTDVPEVTQQYVDKLKNNQCIICSTDLTPVYHSNGIDDKASVQEISNILRKNEENLIAVRNTYDSSEADYNKYVSETANLQNTLKQRSATIDKLIKRLPPEEGVLHEQRSQLNGLRSRVAELRQFLEVKRKEYRIFVDTSSAVILEKVIPLKTAFDTYAQGFLFEKCELIWSPQKLKVGESGEGIDFPAFELDMTGANFPSPVRRTGPEQVSESQREFIDLAFRMAMMDVAGSSAMSSLVIDAPESSLDAVFVSRAALVLTRFANPDKLNRLVITSNLVEGQLIPSLVKGATTGDDIEERVVDLFSIAEPTAAVREWREKYAEIRHKLLYGTVDAK